MDREVEMPLKFGSRVRTARHKYGNMGCLGIPFERSAGHESVLIRKLDGDDDEGGFG